MLGYQPYLVHHQIYTGRLRCSHFPLVTNQYQIAPITPVSLIWIVEPIKSFSHPELQTPSQIVCIVLAIIIIFDNFKYPFSIVYVLVDYLMLFICKYKYIVRIGLRHLQLC